MTPTLTRSALLLLLYAAPSAAGEITASLEPAQTRDPAVYPYRAAVLTIHNKTGRAFRAVRLRWRRGGGPAVVVAATLPPQTKQTVRVFLPAAAAEQTYAVELLSEDRHHSEAAARVEADISWPIAAVTDEAFVDPYPCDRYESAAQPWTALVRARALLVAVLAALAIAATLLAPRGAPRLVLMLLLAAGATAAVWAVGLPQDLVTETHLPLEAATSADRLTVVSTRRTVLWTSADTHLAPIYYNPLQMAAETMVLHHRTGASVRIRPGRVRLFRSRPGAGVAAPQDD